MTTSNFPAFRLVTRSLNFVDMIFVLRSICFAIVVMRSISNPVGWWVVESIYSCGGLVVSLPTVSVPGVTRRSGVGVGVGCGRGVLVGLGETTWFVDAEGPRTEVPVQTSRSQATGMISMI